MASLLQRGFGYRLPAGQSYGFLAASPEDLGATGGFSTGLSTGLDGAVTPGTLAPGGTVCAVAGGEPGGRGRCGARRPSAGLPPITTVSRAGSYSRLATRFTSAKVTAWIRL